MKQPIQSRWRKWLRRLLWLLGCFAFTLAILEVAYRYQWVDTYHRELVALNPDLAANNGRKKVLVLGDSFSAAPNSWVNVLRARHPELQFINSAVPGTTILQANLMLEGRMETYHPDLVIYQVYVGNDLFDLRYPTNWSEVGIFRNLYWMAANHLRSLAWLNYALGQLKRGADLPDLVPEKDNQGDFDSARYAPRERLYLQAEPSLLANTVMLMGDRADDMEDYVEEMRAFIEIVSAAKVPLIVLVLPHCAQVHPRYADRMARLGASGVRAPWFTHPEYHFYRRLLPLAPRNGLVLNPLYELRTCEEADVPMYYLHDPHLNDAGQELVADGVERMMMLYYFGG